MAVYQNKKLRDWTENATTNLVTSPQKVISHEFGIAGSGAYGAAEMVVEWSGDNPESPVADIDPNTMTWHELSEGVFNAGKPYGIVKLPDGWMRIRIRNADGSTNLTVQERSVDG